MADGDSGFDSWRRELPRDVIEHQRDASSIGGSCPIAPFDEPGEGPIDDSWTTAQVYEVALGVILEQSSGLTFETPSPEEVASDVAEEIVQGFARAAASRRRRQRGDT